MLPGNLSTPLQLKQGDTFSLEITLLDDSNTEVDLSGREIRMQLRKSPTAAPIIELSTANGRISVTLGTMALNIAAEDTQALPVADYLFDLQSELLDNVETLLSGKIKVIADVTYGDPA